MSPLQILYNLLVIQLYEYRYWEWKKIWWIRYKCKYLLFL